MARRNVLVTTPNCTQRFPPATVEFSHMLDVDHRQFFTVDSLRELLDSCFRALPRSSRAIRWTSRSPTSSCLAGWAACSAVSRGRALARPRFFSRLLGQGWVSRH